MAGEGRTGEGTSVHERMTIRGLSMGRLALIGGILLLGFSAGAAVSIYVAAQDQRAQAGC